MSVYSSKLCQWAVDMIKRAELGQLTGSVTIYFQEGIVQDTKTEIKQKPPFDKFKK